MIRSQFKVTLILVAVFLIVSIGAKAVGALQPPHPALRGFVEGCEGKPQPCWYGIVPGVTTLEEAAQKLEEQGLSLVEQTPMHLAYSERSRACLITLEIQAPDKASIQIKIFRVSFYLCSDVSVGDMVGVYGNQERYQNGIIFNSGYINATTIDVVRLNSWIINPLEKLTVFTLRSANERITTKYQWHGFVPKWRYCQLEPQFSGCLN